MRASTKTVSGSIFYGFHDVLEDIPLEMIPYFVTCHVNNHTVLNYIDAAQSIGLPSDPCPRRVTDPLRLRSCRTGS